MKDLTITELRNAAMRCPICGIKPEVTLKQHIPDLIHCINKTCTDYCKTFYFADWNKRARMATDWRRVKTSDLQRA